MRTGSNNTIIGASANSNGYNTSTAIGYNAICISNNQIVLGTVNETVYMLNKLGIGTSSPTDSLHVLNGIEFICGQSTFYNYTSGKWKGAGGLQLGWNFQTGVGCTGYLNNSQTYTGGHEFYNIDSTTDVPAWSNVFAGAFSAQSDYRIKENVVNISDTSYNGLIDLIRPVYYFNTHLKSNCFGLIAHEVQEIYPEIVRGKKDEVDANDPSKEIHQSVEYTQFIAILIKELQDVRKTVKLQDDLISKLGERISALENK